MPTKAASIRIADHGLPGNRLHDVVHSTTHTPLLSCSPIRWEEQLTALIKKLICHGNLPNCTTTIQELCAKADKSRY